ncbi:MAG: serine/threonine protein kinase, partial [Acidobacteriota bacterium]
ATPGRHTIRDERASRLNDDVKQVGRYQVQEIIGKGAMGVVYLAYDPQIGRRVALKTIKPQEGARPEEIEENKARFLREAQAAGRLLHPNIVTIFDVFEDKGTMFIAMEHVEGILLDSFCVRGKLLPLPKVLSLVSQGLSALEYAHRHGIVHRDIKPGNMMVVNGDTLKVMDFGLAKKEEANLTQSGTVIGTPHYMSPEQVQGKPLDGRSDLFSMGVVLYELLTGTRPFQGDTLSTIIYKILHEGPPAPRTLNPNLPEALNQIVQKAVDKDPAMRFQTARAFMDAIRNYSRSGFEEILPSLESDPGGNEFLPPPPSSVIRRPRSSSRHAFRKFLFAGAFAALLGGAVAGALYIAGGGLAPSAPAPATKVPVAPSEEKLPRPVKVITNPPGASLFMDGRPVKMVTLAPGDTSAHVVEARLGCLSAKKTIRNGPGLSTIRLALQPGPYKLSVASVPPGAEIFLDGQDTGRVTPADISGSGCSPVKVTLQLAGRETVSQDLDPRKSLSVNISLPVEKPKGTLKLTASSGNIRFYLGDQYLGGPGHDVKLKEGAYTIRILDPKIRGERKVTVKVESGQTRMLKAPRMATGKIFLYGKPNEGKVYVDGSYLDDLPLNGTDPLATGRHRFKVVDPAGSTVSFDWTIHEGEQTKVVDFSKKAVENL